MKQSGMAVVALVGFQKSKGRFATKRWQEIGSIGSYQIEYRCLYKTEAAFAELSLEKQQDLARRILHQAAKRGAVLIGVPMVWRSIFAAQSSIEVVDCRRLMLEQTIKILTQELAGLKGRQIAVLGIEDRLGKVAVELLLQAGAKPVLQGKKAASLADFYYRTQGIALPVAAGRRILVGCSGQIELRPNSKKPQGEHMFDLSERTIKINGVFGAPFEDGCFPGGLAAALITAGATLTEDNKPATLDKPGDLAV